MLRYRSIRKLHLNDSGELPFFQQQSAEVRDKAWKVLPIPPRLQCRIVDLGDISPANTELFMKALNSPACGIQVSDHIHMEYFLELLKHNMISHSDLDLLILTLTLSVS